MTINIIMVNAAHLYFGVCMFLCIDTLWLAANQTGTGSLSMEAQLELLDAHNTFCGMVDPTASNMQRMVSTDSYL